LLSVDSDPFLQLHKISTLDVLVILVNFAATNCSKVSGKYWNNFFEVRLVKFRPQISCIFNRVSCKTPYRALDSAVMHKTLFSARGKQKR